MPFEKQAFILGITASAILSGSYFTLTTLALPTLLHAPTTPTLLTQFSALIHPTTTTLTPLSLLASLSFFANAYNLYHPDVPSRSYKFVAAGLSTLAVLPYTLLAVGPVTRRLREKEGKEGDLEEVKRQVEWWGRVNVGRGLLAVAGTLLAFEAL